MSTASMQVPLLDLTTQYASIQAEIHQAIDAVLATQRFVLGSNVNALEAEVARFCRAPHAVGVASGSDALLLALMAIDVSDGERRLSREPSHNWTPEHEFERSWAVTLLEQVLDRLQMDYESKGKDRLFECLKPFLTVEEDADSYSEISAGLEMTVGAVKVAVHRLRQRYRDLIRQEVASTVENAEDADDELGELLRAIRGG